MWQGVGIARNGVPGGRYVVILSDPCIYQRQRAPLSLLSAQCLRRTSTDSILLLLPLPALTPQDAWSRVFSFLVASQDPATFRGPVAVSRDIANASLACRDMHVAAAGAWRQLAEAAPIPADPLASFAPAAWLPGSLTWDDWDKVLRNPNGCLVPTLKEAARTLKAPVTGAKAELVLRVFEALGMKEPVGAPARLWIACQVDKARAKMREWALKRKEEAERRWAEQRVVLEEQVRRREQQEARWELERAEGMGWGERQQPHHGQQVKCLCGNTASLACFSHKCGKCCRGPCARHSR